MHIYDAHHISRQTQTRHWCLGYQPVGVRWFSAASRSASESLGSSTARARTNAPSAVATALGALVLARGVDEPKLSDALREAALNHLIPTD